MLAEHDEWWDNAWLYRREIVISADQRSLPLGHPVTVRLQTDLKDRGKTRDDLNDVFVIYDGQPVVSKVEIEEVVDSENRTVVHFNLKKDVPAHFSDSYFIYYGNPDQEDPYEETVEIPGL